MTHFRWKKSSFSGNAQGECVEVGFPEGSDRIEVIGVRDSKDPDGGHLELTPSAWRGLLAAVRSGRTQR